MALWIAVPIQEKWITSTNATEAANYVSSGPFMLSEWKHNSDIVLKPNPNWSGTQADPDRDRHVHDGGNRPRARRPTRQASSTWSLTPTEDIQRVKADPTLGPQVVDIPLLVITYYDYNNIDRRPQAVTRQRPRPARR